MRDLDHLQDLISYEVQQLDPLTIEERTVGDGMSRPSLILPYFTAKAYGLQYSWPL